MEELAEDNNNVGIANINSDHTIHSIDELQSLGINVSDIKKLKEAGIATVAGILNLIIII